MRRALCRPTIKVRGLENSHDINTACNTCGEIKEK
jgi:hypothetical protein